MPTPIEWLNGQTSTGEHLDERHVAIFRQRALDSEWRTARNIPDQSGAAWFNESPSRKPFKLNPPTQYASTQLVGDVMTALIREYGLAAKSTCSCKSWAGKMNEWGVAGCREHRAEIIAHLAEAYHSSTWWDTFRAAGSAVYHSLPLTLGGMVDEAIRRTENPVGN